MMRAIRLAVTCSRLSLTLRANISTKEEFIQKLTNKKYRDILGIAEERKDLFRDKDLHRAYLQQVKKFHSDNVQNEQRKRQFEEITKCIIAAYEQLKKEDENYRRPGSNDSVVFHEEEEVAQQLFNKSYNEIKYEMYAPGNEAMRSKFLQQLNCKKNKKKSQQDNFQSSNPTQQTYQQRSNYYSATTSSHSEGSMGKFLALIVACGLLSIPLLGKKEGKGAAEWEKKEVKVREYTQQDYDVMQLNAKKIRMKPLERFYNSILKRRPHMLMYPSRKDPQILQQLSKYSIAPDIHLYEVPSKYFIDEALANQLKAGNNTDLVEKYELTETKPNTLLTLSLQAQRALQNVYVLADDVVSEIKEKGKFTPPKIFFKFHGYIMFEIRPKTLSTLQGYRNTKYISLFDLYFDYYSPIFFKRDYYREYLTGFVEDAPLKNNRYFGNVYLNYRTIPKVYLNKGEKVVFLRQFKKAYDKSGSLKRTEQSYRQDWESYYLRFEKNWKKFCAHQGEGKVIY